MTLRHKVLWLSHHLPDKGPPCHCSNLVVPAAQSGEKHHGHLTARKFGSVANGGHPSGRIGSQPCQQRQTTPVDNAQPGNRKSERMARRELLYTVVREAMVRAGMLSASYKFKVLSLDARGRQFLVMMDLAREHGDETSRLAEIEALIAQSAKSRYDIVVTAVYWRLNDHVAVGLPQSRHPQARPSAPMPLEPLAAAPVSQPAPLVSQPMPFPVTRAAAATAGGGRYDPIEADEVAAFKQALAVPASRRGPWLQCRRPL
jgi:hypothetical protein